MFNLIARVDPDYVTPKYAKGPREKDIICRLNTKAGR